MTARGRGVRRLAQVAGLLAALVAAGPRMAAAADTLHLLVPIYSDATAPYFERMSADFIAANPGITIVAEAVPWPALQARLAASVAAGHPPDLAIIRSAWLPELVQAGTVDPLEPRMSAEFRSRFIDGLLAAGRIGPHLYGLPVAVEVRALFYNRDLLDHAGLPGPPASWAALAADAGRLQAAGIVPFGLAAAPGEAGRSWDCAALSYGGAMLDPTGHVAVAAPAGEAALRMLRGLVIAGATEAAATEQGDAALQDLFVQGQVAMVLAPQSLLTHMLRAPGRPRFGVVGPPAQGTPSPANCASSDSVVLLHASTVRNTAFKFLDFLFTRTPRLALTRDEGLSPVTRAELRDKSVSGDADRALFARLLPQASFPPLLVGWAAASDILDRAVAAALRGEAEPAAALTAAAAQMTAALGQ